MASLPNVLRTLTETFARGIFESLREASLDEIFGREVGVGSPTRKEPYPAPSSPSKEPRKGGRRRTPRRAADLAAILEQVVELLRAHPLGLRAEELRAELGLSRAELARPVAEGLARKQIRKTGHKRATTYFLVKGAAPASESDAIPRRGRPARKSLPPREEKAKVADPTSRRGRTARKGTPLREQNAQVADAPRRGRAARKSTAVPPTRTQETGSGGTPRRARAPVPRTPKTKPKKRGAYVYVTEAGLAAERGEAVPGTKSE
jgi:hypothetical protein